MTNLPSIAQIAHALGGDVHQGYILAPGPGHSARDRSLKVWIDHDGRLACCSFASNAWYLCMDHIRAKLGLPAFANDKPEKNQRTSEQRLADALQRWQKDAADYRADANAASRSWRRAVDPGGTPAIDYLKNRRLDLEEGMAGHLVRYLDDCPKQGGRARAMLIGFSPIVGPAETVPWGKDPPVTCIQRIFLDPGQPKGHDGKWLLGHPFSLPKPALREGRVYLPPKMPLSVIKLTGDEEVETGLHLAEGFETGLASMMAGFRPLWAVYSAEAMARFPVLPGIAAITLMADNDASGAGERAARSCGSHWERVGKEARVIIRNGIGDWADAWGTGG